MCRWIVYFGPETVIADVILRPEHGLVSVSQQFQYLPQVDVSKQHNRKVNHMVNAEGFGIGFYVAESFTPALLKSILPAWNDRNLRTISNVVRSDLIFAHCRATGGGLSISDLNCHPFQRGRYMFMHNGDIKNFRMLKRKFSEKIAVELYSSVEGTTDSEICFMIFLTILGRVKKSFDFCSMNATPDEIKDSMIEAIKTIDGITGKPSTMNFAVSDGRTIVATRFRNDPDNDPASLYVAKGKKFLQDWHGIRGERKPIFVKTKTPTEGDDTVPINVGMISSEPLTYADGDWCLVKKNHIVVMYNTKTDSPERKDRPSVALHITEFPILDDGTQIEQKDDGSTSAPQETGKEDIHRFCRKPSCVHNPETLDDLLTELYNKLDVNNDGTVDQQELNPLVQMIVQNPEDVWNFRDTWERLNTIAAENKFITLPEFLKVCRTEFMDHGRKIRISAKLHKEYDLSSNTCKDGKCWEETDMYV